MLCLAALVLHASRLTAAQGISTCLASVNIVTVTDNVTEIVTETIVETVTATTIPINPTNGTISSDYPSFTYLPTSASSVELLDIDNTSTSFSTSSAFTNTLPATFRAPHTLPGPGTSGWNITVTIEATTTTEETSILSTTASETRTMPSIFGRAAQLDNVVVGRFTETGPGGVPYPGPRRYSPGTLFNPAFPPVPPYPTTASDANPTKPAYVTGTAGTSCEEETSGPTTLSTRTISLSTGTGAVPAETGCGETGDFRFGFDDLPRFVTNLTDITQAVPVFSPYHHFVFSQGYVYAPLPETPFQAVTPPHLAVFITNETGAPNVPSPGFVRPGEIGAGARLSDQAHWFNAYSAYLGCDNTDSPGCMYEISGYVYDRSSRAEILAYQSNVTVPACPTLHDCLLTFVDFPLDMRGLSGFQIRAFAGDQQRIWFMDELALGWWDNSCEAGQIRTRSRKRSLGA
ncbi:hypothetical protein B9Z65_5443 [Elsinoe australis]|uniref:DUF7371 domain-containing protein n=1 Tax=Elsinoe australis TaxID=40998 RepID=A0A2P7ZE38_9PEZI|nr:hypothetical protein B9Z65_5443 [Elsinoe australis]